MHLELVQEMEHCRAEQVSQSLIPFSNLFPFNIFTFYFLLPVVIQAFLSSFHIILKANFCIYRSATSILIYSGLLVILLQF